MHRRNTHTFALKHKRNIADWGPTRVLEDNIKIYISQIGYDWVDRIYVF